MQLPVVCAAILPAITGKLPQAGSSHIVIFVAHRITTDYGKSNTSGQEYKTF
jgi:hypothetical protein